MGRSIIPGGTDYSNQSISDIRKDLFDWIDFCNSTKESIETIIKELNGNDYWDKTVPFDFRMFCISTRDSCDTFASDFRCVMDAIDKDRITKREIKLMQKVYNVSKVEEGQSWRTFKNREDGNWKQYGDASFKKVEDLYKKTRDFYVNMFDINNVAARLEDYVKEDVSIDNSINANNSVVIGNGNTIEKSNLTANGEAKKPWYIWLLEHFWVPITVAVISGIIVWFLTKYI